MCLEMLLAAAPGLIASAGGAVINGQIQNQAIAETNRQNQMAVDMQQQARIAESERQRQMEMQQAQRVAEALTRIDPAKTAETVEQQTAAPDNEFVQAAEDYNVPTLQGQITTGGTAKDIGRTVADAVERAKGMLRAQSTLSGQDTAGLGRQDELIRMAGDVGTIGNRRQGSLFAGQLESTIGPATVTPSDSILGDALLLLGTGLSGYGGRQAGRAPASGGQPLSAIPWLTPTSPFGQPLTGAR